MYQIFMHGKLLQQLIKKNNQKRLQEAGKIFKNWVQKSLKCFYVDTMQK